MWNYCDKERPEIGVPVIVYRPNTMYFGCYEAPLAIAMFDGKKYSCHIQPLKWKSFELPSDWTDEHNKYQTY